MHLRLISPAQPNCNVPAAGGSFLLDLLRFRFPLTGGPDLPLGTPFSSSRNNTPAHSPSTHSSPHPLPPPPPCAGRNFRPALSPDLNPNAEPNNDTSILGVLAICPATSGGSSTSPSSRPGAGGMEYAGKEIPNIVPSFGTTLTISSLVTMRKVLAVSSMTIPLIPTRLGLRDELMERMIPVNSALTSLDWTDSGDVPMGREGRGDGSRAGRGGRERSCRR